MTDQSPIDFRVAVKTRRGMQIPKERYAKMIELTLLLVEQMDGMRSGKLILSFNGNSVAPGLEQAWGPDWLEKHTG
jgi:hypothetical protein